MSINSIKRIVITLLAALTLIAACLCQPPAQAATSLPVDQKGEHIDLLSFHWGIGIANEQSIRATLANLVPAGVDPTNTISVGATLILYDERGRVAAQSEEEEILSGKSHSFDIAGRAIFKRGDRKNKRVQVFAVLQVYASGLDDEAAQAIKGKASEFLPASFELINSDGATSVASISDGTSNTLLVGERPPSEGDSGHNPADGSVRFLSTSVGINPVQSLTFSARNLSKPDETGEPIVLQVNAYDQNGDLIAVSPQVEIPPNEFRTVRLDYNDLATPGEPGTGRKQIRTVPLWGLRARTRLPVAVSLEIVNATDGRSAGAVAGVLYAAFHNND